MPYPDTADGFMVNDHKDWSTFRKQEVEGRPCFLDCMSRSLQCFQFKLKPFEEHDVDVAIDACGVCGSDVHTITGGWGEAPMPLCVGHEIVGRVVNTGRKVNTVKVGDRVGVGAQISTSSFRSPTTYPPNSPHPCSAQASPPSAPSSA